MTGIQALKNTKEVEKIVTGYATQDGAGVKLIRVIGNDDVYDTDPFLMLDAFDSSKAEDYRRGFPLHPHRGIETVTYLVEGRIDHRDSLGNEGSIQSGQAQWMTAGSGILHEEMPQPADRLFGLQLWVNLPQSDKMTEPHYFDITQDMIPEADYDWGRIRVIAGEFDGIQGVEPLYVQVTMLDIAVKPGESFTMPIEHDATALVYVLEGNGGFGAEGATELTAKTAAVFGPGDTFYAEAGNDGMRFMLFAGMPLGDPIAWGGPVVMNTEEELRQAFRELDEGTFIKQ